ncbi:MAG TPA: 4Fe-4S binding protein, partial [Vicinamibacterales bacterium]|nr:4Fe-4S binding protein [Vicinamibacterales bacterium]
MPMITVSEDRCKGCALCVRVCPTGALREKSAAEDVAKALANPQLDVIAQIAPAVPATVAAEVGLR